VIVGGESYKFRRRAWVGGLWFSLSAGFAKLAHSKFVGDNNIHGTALLVVGAICLFYALWCWFVPYIRITDEILMLNLGLLRNRIVRITEITRYETGRNKVVLHKDMKDQVKIDMLMLGRTDRERLMSFLINRFG
jgi:hypothetical protein